MLLALEPGIDLGKPLAYGEEVHSSVQASLVAAGGVPGGGTGRRK